MLQPLLSACFLLFLVLVGFSALHWVATRNAPLLSINPLPQRATAKQEWGLGVVLGWGMLVATVVPAVLAGVLHPHFWIQPRSVLLWLVALAALAVFTLAIEAVFRGYLYVRLIHACGTSFATVAMACLYAAVSAFHPNATRLSVLVSFLLGLLASFAYLRTRALWMAWGIHFGWAASMIAIFGLPVGGVDAYSSVVETTISGRNWLSGGTYGPEGSLVAVAVVLAAIPVLYKITADYAWHYTFEAPEGAGYPMEAKPPAAHVAMEQAARPAPLVQILPSTPERASTLPAVEDHLRSAAAAGREPD